MADITQLNFRVPNKLAERIRGEARRSRKALDAIGTVILQDFFTAFSRKERDQFYEGAPLKRTGRKVKAAK